MKLFSLLLVLALMVASTYAQNAGKPMQAELVRSTTGRGFDSSGLANIPVPLQKGAIYDVTRQENGSVVLNVNGQNVLVQSGAVRLAEKPQDAAATATGGAVAPGFVPGKIVLVSAKYSLDGNQPTNVKNNLQKLIPQGVINKPVVIVVSDELSAAAQDQGTVTTGTVVTSGNTSNVFLRTASPNVLTVKYVFNGQEFTKQVPEGQQLVLP